jgi:signal transduction histidine kinase
MSGTAKAREEGLARMLVSALDRRETDMSRISGVLHDHVSQVLSAAGLQLGLLRLDFQERAPEIEQRTNEIQQLLESVIDQLRDLSYELNPSIVERTGLQTALDRLAGRIRKGSRIGLRVHYEPGLRVPVPIATAFYKIAERAADEGVAQSCLEMEMQVKTAHAEWVLEVRMDCEFRDEFGDGQSVPMLMMEHYAASSGVALEIRHDRPGTTVVRAAHSVISVEPAVIIDQATGEE